MGLPPAPAGIPGQSLVKRWEGKQKDPDRPIFAAQGTPGKNRAVMLRTARYKLTRFDDGGGELYDLVRDPDELTNVIDHPEMAPIKAGLQHQLDTWERQYPHRV